jgi:long-chain acyl-CoA synthetase
MDWAKDNGHGGKTYAELVATDDVVNLVQGYVDQLNLELNRWETIKKFRLLDHDLTVESGELTPSMKVKRNVVEDNHKVTIDAMYSD